MKKNILVVGGLSDIAQSVISTISSEDYNIYSIVRDEDNSATLTAL